MITRSLFVLSFFLVALTAWFNNSIVAVDDYNSSIIKCIPAQNIDFDFVVRSADIRSPIPGYVFLALTKTAYALGFDRPLDQLAFARLALGCVGFLICYVSCFGILKVYFPRRDRFFDISLSLLLGFFAGISLIYTRLMFECLAMPVVALFAFFLVKYQRTQRFSHLAWAVFSLTFACLFRPQVGILLIFPFSMLLLSARFREFIKLGLVALFALVVSGLPDYFWFGRLHDSLFRYASWNMAHTNDFIQGDFWVYPVLFFALTLPPVLFFSYSKKLRQELLSMRLLWVMGLLFIVSHSLLLNKQERFMIPIFPLFIVLLVPIISEMFRTKRYLRLSVFFGIHAGINILLASQTLQNNVVSLMSFLEKEGKISTLYLPDENGFMLIPKAYASRGVAVHGFKALADIGDIGPDQAVVVRKDLLDGFLQQDAAKDLELRQEFYPDIVERFIIEFNPSLNGRRGTLALLQKKSAH